MRGLLYFFLLGAKCTTIWLDPSPSPESDPNLLLGENTKPSNNLEDYGSLEEYLVTKQAYRKQLR